LLREEEEEESTEIKCTLHEGLWLSVEPFERNFTATPKIWIYQRYPVFNFEPRRKTTSLQQDVISGYPVTILVRLTAFLNSSGTLWKVMFSQMLKKFAIFIAVYDSLLYSRKLKNKIYCGPLKFNVYFQDVFRKTYLNTSLQSTLVFPKFVHHYRFPH
jgi:hypothetical protein